MYETSPVQPVQTGLVGRVAKELLGFLRLRRPLRFWGRPKFLAGKMRPFDRREKSAFNCLFITRSSGVDPEVKPVDILCYFVSGTINVETL